MKEQNNNSILFILVLVAIMNPIITELQKMPLILKIKISEILTLYITEDTDKITGNTITIKKSILAQIDSMSIFFLNFIKYYDVLIYFFIIHRWILFNFRTKIEIK